MKEIERLLKKVEEILARDPSYKFEAYSFVMAGLHFAVAKFEKPRHVTGKELCKGLRDYALDQFGPMARTVLEHWGIKKTEDFGKIVFHLIDAELLRKTEEDSIHDFDNLYDFSKAFRYKIKEEKGED